MGGRIEDSFAAAKEAGLDTLLLAQFGAGGVEGSDGAAEVVARVGATAALAKQGAAEGAEGARLEAATCLPGTSPA